MPGVHKPIAPYCRPLAVRDEPKRSQFGRQTVTGRVGPREYSTVIDMSVSEKQRAKDLAKHWGLSVRHALYRKTGNWYHQLSKFPGALLDANGDVIFDTEHAFRTCPQLQIGKQVGAPHGIKVIPGYVHVLADDDQTEGMLVESLVRPRVVRRGQRWGVSAENRKAVEAYAMKRAVSHYSGIWREVRDVSATEPFDLLCRDGGRELRVEVKGATSIGSSVLLTRNEVRHARENAGRVALFVVSEIASDSGSCSGGTVSIFEPWNINQDELEPIAFECHLRAQPNTALQTDERRALISPNPKVNSRAARG